MSKWRKAVNTGGKGLSPSQFRKQQNANGGLGNKVIYPNRGFASSPRRRFPQNIGLLRSHEAQCPGYLDEVRSLSNNPSQMNLQRVMNYINSCPNKGAIRNAVNIGGIGNEHDSTWGWLWCLCCMVSDIMGDGGACCECHRCACKSKNDDQHTE